MSLSLAAATLGAGIISGATSAFGAHKAGEDAKRATEAQIAWERERATHAHQWEMEDLKKAGLNPILAAGGSGAVTGGISAPMPDRSGYTQAGTAIMNAINSAYGAAKTNAEIGKTGAETQNLTQDTKNKIAQEELIKKQAINEALRSGLITAQKANIEFKNLTEKYNGERAALTYWNNFLNTASTTAKNASEAGLNVLDRLVPAKHIKEVKRIFYRGKGYSENTLSY